MNISQFKVERNNLSGELPEFLGTMSRLRHFYIYDNEFTGQFPESFTGMYMTGITFQIYNNNFDRDADHTTHFSTDLQNWFDSLVPYA